MIKSFRNKGLKEVFETGRSKRVRADQLIRIADRLEVLDRASTIKNIDVPGFRLHRLKGADRWAIAVNGPWRITFGWDDQNVTDVDLEQYH